MLYLQYFHTIKSILNNHEIRSIHEMMKYFHTIKSILNKGAIKYVCNYL